MILSIFLGIISILVITALSMFLGLYIQNKFSILKNNYYATYGIGFLLYIAIISIMFMPVMMASLSGTALFSVWWVTNIVIIMFLIWKYKFIQLSKVNLYQFLLFISLGIIVTIATRFMGSLPKSGDNIFYIPWVRGNQYIDHLNMGKFRSIGKFYQGEGWYYFQTVLLRTTHMDQNFMNLWVFGAFTNFLLVSSVLSIVNTITKSNNILFLVSTVCFGVGVGWLINGSTYSNIGSTTLIWVMVLLFTIGISYIQTEKNQYIYLLASIAYAGWSISSSSLFIFGIMYVSIIFVLIFKKSKNIILFSLINATSIAIMLLTMFWHNNQILAYAIGICLLISIIFVRLSTYYNKHTERASIFISQYKYWLIGITFTSIIIMSSILWWKNGKNPWLNFSYRGDGITPYITNDSMLWLDIGKYLLYWIFVIYVGYIVVINIKQGIKNNELNSLILIISVSIILFYNPLVASLWNGPIIPNAVYHRVRLNVIVPMYFVIIILMNKIKLKYARTTIYFLIPLATISTVIVPFASQKIMRNYFSGFTGYGKDLNTVGHFIKNNNLESKAMTGDTNGIQAYIDNPLAFGRNSSLYNQMNYTFLTTNIYSKLPVKDANQIQLLVKITLNLGDFNYQKFNFNNMKSFGHYNIYWKT